MFLSVYIDSANHTALKTTWLIKQVSNSSSLWFIDNTRLPMRFKGNTVRDAKFTQVLLVA